MNITYSRQTIVLVIGGADELWLIGAIANVTIWYNNNNNNMQISRAP